MMRQQRAALDYQILQRATSDQHQTQPAIAEYIMRRQQYQKVMKSTKIREFCFRSRALQLEHHNVTLRMLEPIVEAGAECAKYDELGLIEDLDSDLHESEGNISPEQSVTGKTSAEARQVGRNMDSQPVCGPSLDVRKRILFMKIHWRWYGRIAIVKPLQLYFPGLTMTERQVRGIYELLGQTNKQMYEQLLATQSITKIRSPASVRDRQGRITLDRRILAITTGNLEVARAAIARFSKAVRTGMSCTTKLYPKLAFTAGLCS